MQTWHIHIQGQVQGVGFRPFVFLLAQQYELNGWVNNDIDGVHIEFTAKQQKANDFLNNILEKKPALAQVTTHEIIKISSKHFSYFEIRDSQTKGQSKLLLTPDAAICADCTRELFAAANRRKDYPFITCTNCGPRYSIIKQLPYDRPMTTMDAFQMCPSCNKEYKDITDRRFYSQTTSCPDCAIELGLYDCQSKVGNPVKVSADFTTNELLEKIVQLWEAGHIVAIKGIGGYLLTCDAGNEMAVRELRRRKHRPSKPFAIMFPDLKMLRQVLEMGKAEENLLTNSAAPIVLLQKKELLDTFKDFDTLTSSVSPRLNQVGAMLPYTPLYQLLLKKINKPIVATSGNISNSPIVFEDEKAIQELSSLADFILINNRTIVVPQDDSLIKLTPFKKHEIVLRRSRGYAPTYISKGLTFSNTTQLAMGAMLKSTFTLVHQGNTFISPYLGDLENYETQENYRHTLQHFLQLFQTQPKIILLDQHPQYPSNLYGKELANQLKVPTISIQHHEAHFAAILAEHELINSSTPILGFIWDGTGLGNDGHIWGGEVFSYQNYHFQRVHHLEYVAFIAGDKMPKEPRISALAFCWNIPEILPILKDKFTTTEWSIYTQLLKKENSLQTSSMGRLFDAVASLLGILDKQSYEGEAALLLETKAISFFQKNGLSTFFSSFTENKANFSYTTKNILSSILFDIAQGESIDYIAAHFHFLLVRYIEQIAIEQNIQKIAFSGGVFQNGLLVDLLIHHLGTSFDLFFHKELSPNDENVSFGQLVWYRIRNEEIDNFK